MVGYRQRAQLAASGAADPSQPVESTLAKHLLNLWAWGEMSAPKVQQIAAAAKADGLSHPQVDMLASLGTGGKHARNCHPELLRKLQASPLPPTSTHFRLPMFLPPTGHRFVDQAILLPHEMFALLYSKYPQAFQDRVLGADGAVEAFWSSAAGLPMFQGHSVLSRPNYQRLACPLSLHGDGVPVAGVGKVHSKAASSVLWCYTSGLFFRRIPLFFRRVPLVFCQRGLFFFQTGSIFQTNPPWFFSDGSGRCLGWEGKGREKPCRA